MLKLAKLDDLKALAEQSGCTDFQVIRDGTVAGIAVCWRTRPWEFTFDLAGCTQPQVDVMVGRAKAALRRLTNEDRAKHG